MGSDAASPPAISGAGHGVGDSFTTPYTDTIAGHKFIRGLFLSLHPAVEMLRQLIVQLSCLAQLACCQATVSSYHFRLTLPDLQPRVRNIPTTFSRYPSIQSEANLSAALPNCTSHAQRLVALPSESPRCASH